MSVTLWNMRTAIYVCVIKSNNKVPFCSTKNKIKPNTKEIDFCTPI